MYCRIAITFLLLGFSVFHAKAQPLEKARNSTALWATTSFYTDSLHKAHWMAETQLRHSTLANASNRFSEAFPFYRTQLLVGKQWRFTYNWQGGLSLRPTFEHNRSQLFSRFFLQHFGRLGKFQLFKRLSFEQISTTQERPLYWARTSGYVDIRRIFNLGKLSLESSLSFIFFLNHRTSDNPIAPENERNINRTRLRFETGIVAGNWLFAPFILRETNYFFAQEVFDEEGSLKKPFRKLNIFTPTYGVSLRYIWNKTSKEKLTE